MSAVSTRILLSGPEARVGEALEPLRRFAAQAGLPEALRGDLMVIADEVVSNWLKYGRAGAQAPEMEILARIDEGQLRLSFADTGPAFDPLAAPPPDLDVPLEERPVGGVGVLLVRELTESQRYARIGDRNVLELTRSIPKSGNPR